jgi:2-desacetyl-2-hydroxyethyl bacteriochlorophyllide A dehydrogenase
MRALTVIPGVRGSAAVRDVPEPPASDGEVLVATHAMGICGTDREILDGQYGAAPPGAERLVLGHESIGRVREAPGESGLLPGDWVVGIVRRPDPVPCSSCRVGEWDMCRNGRYTEHGIRGLHGFGADRYRSSASYLVKVDPALGELGVLLEPTSVVAKAWEHVRRTGERAHWEPRHVLVVGAGPIGLLAALLSVQHGLEVHVLDRSEKGTKPELVRALGATYHAEGFAALGREWDIIFECTGASSLFFDVLHAAAPGGIVCLTGVSTGGRSVSVDPGLLNRELVLENNAVLGSVNANRRHYEAAATALARAEPGWLRRLITRRIPVAEWASAFEPHADDVKTILTFGA